MTPLTDRLGLPRDRGPRVLVVGAHSDDAEIGAGGTIARLVAERPDADVTWLVLAAADPVRAAEARASADALPRGRRGAPSSTCATCATATSRTSARRPRRRSPRTPAFDPDLILSPRRDDAHQDHRHVAELVPQVFRRADGPRVRDPEVGRRPRRGEPLRPARRGGGGREGRPRHGGLPLAGGQGLVHGGHAASRSSACAASSAGRRTASPRRSSAASSSSDQHPTQAEASERMRVLVTGHRGYIGAVLVPIFQAAGHEVVGLDSDLYRGCTFGDPAAPRPIPELGVDLRDVDRRAARRDRRHRPPRRPVQRPPRRPRRGPDVRHQPPRERPAGPPRARRRRAPLPLLVVVQQLRRRRRGDLLDEDSPLRPVTAVRRVEGPRGARHRGAGRPVVHGRLAPQRHGLRRLTPPAL